MTDPERPAVLIVGLFHFAGSPDLVSVTDDMLTPRRQQEIIDLVDRLERWSPTKIAVEAMPGSEALHQRFAAFVEGDHEPSANEVEQVGFRLGHRLGHRALFGIDADNSTAMSDVERDADEAVMKRLVEWGKRMSAEEAHALKSSTLAEYLRRINASSRLNATHECYLDELLSVGVGTTFSGAELATSIYRRNLRIFANLRAVVGPGDRAVVLMGASHARALREFLSIWNRWKVVDPLEIL